MIEELCERRPYMVVRYARHEGEMPSYEYLAHRACFLDASNVERKMLRELKLATHDASTIENDGVEVVAYAMADDATSFEDSSYAVIAYEQRAGGPVDEWIGDEISESIQLW